MSAGQTMKAFLSLALWTDVMRVAALAAMRLCHICTYPAVSTQRGGLEVFGTFSRTLRPRTRQWSLPKTLAGAVAARATPAIMVSS